MWACVRDWDWEEMMACGVGLGEFACFRFDERSRQFVSWVLLMILVAYGFSCFRIDSYLIIICALLFDS